MPEVELAIAVSMLTRTQINAPRMATTVISKLSSLSSAGDRDASLNPARRPHGGGGGGGHAYAYVIAIVVGGTMWWRSWW
jgi:hypothetical protein